jgi:hypothetical protein
MINLDMVPVDGGENPAAGTRWHCADRNEMCCISPAFFLADKHASLTKQTVYPVLCGAPGNMRGILDISYRKKTFIQRELPHQAEILTPSFKNGGHNGL